jgi:GDP-L-fucose synthase
MQYKTSVEKKDFHPDTLNFFSGQKVIVTGGSGFIGSHVVEQLLELNAHPIVISRQKNPEFLAHLSNQSDSKKIEIQKCDLYDFAETKKSFKDADVVLNLAASVAGIEYNKNHPASIFQDNLQCFFNSIKAATEVGIKRYLVTSSACVYPRHCSIPTPESEGFYDEPEPTNSGYGWSKRMEEYLGQKYAEEFNLSVAIARPYNAYGPRDNFNPKSSHVIPALILKAFQTQTESFEVWGDGTHSRSFLYVDDFARGLIEVAARYPKADPVNIGAEEEISIRDMALLIADFVGTVRGVKLVPKFNSNGITGQPRRKCDGTKSKEQLNYLAQVSIKDGLKKTIDWFNNEYKKNRSVYSNS